MALKLNVSSRPSTLLLAPTSSSISPPSPRPNLSGDLSKLRGLIDLDKVIVNTGFAEVGPWGSSRTRWEMEVRGDFTLEGWVEMAWIMGYIKHFDGRLKNGSLYVGWVESKSGEPVDEKDVKSKFEKDILAHAGVRLIGKKLICLLLTHSNGMHRTGVVARIRSQEEGFPPGSRARPRFGAHGSLRG
jgi:3-oxoacyl-ACP reductase-like protein